MEGQGLVLVLPEVVLKAFVLGPALELGGLVKADTDNLYV
jgi:hypothetical protein